MIAFHGESSRDAISAQIADPLMRRFEAGHVGLRRQKVVSAEKSA